MFKNPSLVTRIAIGKGAGFVIGLIGMISLPYFWPEATWLIRWGLLFWYTTLGAIIGMLGVFTWNPVLKMPMPWWFSAPLIGAWMNFVLTFFAYDTMQTIMIATFGPQGVLQSPFWFVAEGALFGLIVGFLATRFGGEGAEALDTVVPE